MRPRDRQATTTSSTSAARRIPALAAVAAVALLGAGCSDDDGGSSTETTAVAPSSVPEVVEAEQTPTIRLEPTGIELESPIALVSVPDTSSVLIATQDGQVYEAVVADGQLDLVEEPLLDLTELVGAAQGEQGLLGLAVHPDRSSVYASYTAADEGGASRLDRFELSGTSGELRASADSRTNLLDVEQPFSNHNGGHITFGPDGMLYLALGDGGSGGDPDGRAQDRESLLGKILRLDPDASGPDDIAAEGNPFTMDGAEGEQGRPEIWLTGVRNPWRFGFDPDTGDLWIADVGQDRHEEVNRLLASDATGKGANLGWDLYEGSEPFADPDPAEGAASDGPFIEPVFTYPRDEGCSITGGLVAHDPDVPTLDGIYLFADYCTPGLRGLRVTDGAVESLRLLDEPGSVVSFAEGPDGEIYVLSQSDGINRIVEG